MPQVVCVHGPEAWQAPATQTSPEAQSASVVHPEDPGTLTAFWHTWPLGHSLSTAHPVVVQTPAAQLVSARARDPQAPQLAGSVCVSTHWVPHVVWVQVDWTTHAPPLHTSPEGQSLSVAHAAEGEQAPAMQLDPDGQASPQAPQLAASVWRSTHWLPQEVCAQGLEQRPATHTSPLGAVVWRRWLAPRGRRSRSEAHPSPVGQSLAVAQATGCCSVPMGMLPLLQAPDGGDREQAGERAKEGSLEEIEAGKALMEDVLRVGRSGSGASPRRARASS